MQQTRRKSGGAAEAASERCLKLGKSFTPNFRSRASGASSNKSRTSIDPLRRRDEHMIPNDLSRAPLLNTRSLTGSKIAQNGRQVKEPRAVERQSKMVLRHV